MQRYFRRKEVERDRMRARAARRQSRDERMQTMASVYGRQGSRQQLGGAGGNTRSTKQLAYGEHAAPVVTRGDAEDADLAAYILNAGHSFSAAAAGDAGAVHDRRDLPDQQRHRA